MHKYQLLLQLSFIHKIYKCGSLIAVEEISNEHENNLQQMHATLERYTDICTSKGIYKYWRSVFRVTIYRQATYIYFLTSECLNTIVKSIFRCFRQYVIVYCLINSFHSHTCNLPVSVSNRSSPCINSVLSFVVSINLQ